MSTSRGPEAGAGRPVGERRRARERALALLYEAETKSLTPAEVLAALPSPPEPYAEQLFLGVGRRAAEIDTLVAGQADRWRLDRMPAVDRQLLRLAVLELLEHPEVPLAVVIDEAVQLAGAYSTEGSGRFVNGVLAALATRLRAPEVRPA